MHTLLAPNDYPVSMLSDEYLTAFCASLFVFWPFFFLYLFTGVLSPQATDTPLPFNRTFLSKRRHLPMMADLTGLSRGQVCITIQCRPICLRFPVCFVTELHIFGLLSTNNPSLSTEEASVRRLSCSFVSEKISSPTSGPLCIGFKKNTPGIGGLLNRKLASINASRVFDCMLEMILSGVFGRRMLIRLECLFAGLPSNRTICKPNFLNTLPFIHHLDPFLIKVCLKSKIFLLPNFSTTHDQQQVAQTANLMGAPTTLLDQECVDGKATVGSRSLWKSRLDQRRVQLYLFDRGWQRVRGCDGRLISSHDSF